MISGNEENNHRGGHIVIKIPSVMSFVERLGKGHIKNTKSIFIKKFEALVFLTFKSRKFLRKGGSTCWKL